VAAVARGTVAWGEARAAVLVVVTVVVGERVGGALLVVATGRVVSGDVIVATPVAALVPVGAEGVPRSAPVTIATLATRSSAVPRRRRPIRQVIVGLLSAARVSSAVAR
jgi:acetyl-CoA carboxylase carboxyltransferase component